MRWIRLGFGLFLTVQAFQLHDGFAAVIAAFFLFQAVTNTGCCGTSGCSIPAQNTKATNTEEVSFEEVTQQKNKP